VRILALNDETVLNLAEFAVAALAFVILAELIAHRSGVPSAAVLVLIGLIYGLLPGPNVPLDPEFILVIVLPLLLYSAALNASLLEIRANMRAIISLSVVLVLITAVVTGAALTAVVPGVPLAAAIALGAAVAPPDPVASLAVAQRAGLPPRLITLIEGEGLLNDATALTAFEVAVAAASGEEFSLGAASLRFVLAAVGGVAVGLVVAWLIRLVRRGIDDPILDNALSLATPFLAFVPATTLNVSGILAVVTAGLWLGHEAPVQLSSASRLQTRAVWRLVDFVLEGFVFLLIGDQLPAVLSGLEVYAWETVLLAALACVLAVLISRPVWLWLSFSLPDRLFPHRLAFTRLSWPELLVFSWADTRGVISLAVIFGLPLDFPYRNLLLFCTYVVVMVTLLGQGATFNWLVRLLHLQTDRVEELHVWDAARTAAIEAGVQRLDELTTEEPGLEPLAEPLRRRAAERRALGAEWMRKVAADGDPSDAETPAAMTVRLRRQMIEAEREELVRWRDAGRLPQNGLRALERELDHEEGLLP
jgi:CPA1 family monovalent cation:H+ antiporter